MPSSDPPLCVPHSLCSPFVENNSFSIRLSSLSNTGPQHGLTRHCFHVLFRRHKPARTFCVIRQRNGGGNISTYSEMPPLP